MSDAMADDFLKTEKSLDELLKRLDPKAMRRAMRNTFAAEMRKVKKEARRELSATDLHNAAEVARQAIWGGVWKKKLDGFAVSASHVKKSSRAGFYRNSKGKLKPVALWFDRGTDYRYTRALHKKYRGRIEPPLNFVETAERKAVPESERRIVEAFRKKVEQQVEKYGK